MIVFDTGSFDADLKKFKELMTLGLAKVIRDYISTFVGLLANQNPVGDDVTYKNWYLFRQRWYDEELGLTLKPQAGLSKSNWRVVLTDSATDFVQQYHADEGKIEAAAFNKLAKYKLGQTIYIVNNVPYVYEDGAGQVGVGRSSEKVDVATAYQISFAEFSKGIARLQKQLGSR